jgi:hypothetical protein
MLSEVHAVGTDFECNLDPIVHDEKDAGRPAALGQRSGEGKQLVVGELRRAEL